jgi:hypothetical protein
VHSERNLAVTLRFIDPRSPERSPLLTVPQGNHGRAGRTIFSGPSGDEQLETLRTWVRQVARDQAVAKAAGGEKPPAHSTPDSDAPLPVQIEPARSDAAAAALHRVPRGVAEGAIPFDEPSPSEMPPDAFDPREFNRVLGDPGENAASGRRE